MRNTQSAPRWADRATSFCTPVNAARWLRAGFFVVVVAVTDVEDGGGETWVVTGGKDGVTGRSWPRSSREKVTTVAPARERTARMRTRMAWASLPDVRPNGHRRGSTSLS